MKLKKFILKTNLIFFEINFIIIINVIIFINNNKILFISNIYYYILYKYIINIYRFKINKLILLFIVNIFIFHGKGGNFPISDSIDHNFSIG